MLELAGAPGFRVIEILSTPKLLPIPLVELEEVATSDMAEVIRSKVALVL